MGIQDLVAHSRPVGWQTILNPKLTRRGLLGGMVASPVALCGSVGHANLSITYDLRFDLSPDLRMLTVMELEVCNIKQALPPPHRLPVAGLTPFGWK